MYIKPVWECRRYYTTLYQGCYAVHTDDVCLLFSPSISRVAACGYQLDTATGLLPCQIQPTAAHCQLPPLVGRSHWKVPGSRCRRSLFRLSSIFVLYAFWPLPVHIQGCLLMIINWSLLLAGDKVKHKGPNVEGLSVSVQVLEYWTEPHPICVMAGIC